MTWICLNLSVLFCNKVLSYPPSLSLSVCLSLSVYTCTNRQPACAGEELTCLRMAWKMLKSVILCNKVLSYPLSLYTSVPAILCNKVLSYPLSLYTSVPACAREVLTCLRMAWKMSRGLLRSIPRVPGRASSSLLWCSSNSCSCSSTSGSPSFLKVKRS